MGEAHSAICDVDVLPPFARRAVGGDAALGEKGAVIAGKDNSFLHHIKVFASLYFFIEILHA